MTISFTDSYDNPYELEIDQSENTKISLYDVRRDIFYECTVVRSVVNLTEWFCNPVFRGPMFIIRFWLNREWVVLQISDCNIVKQYSLLS